MTTHVVQRIKTDILKDAVVSILMQRVHYQMIGCSDSYLVLAGLMTRLPDTFEIELDEYSAKDALDQTMKTVNAISFRIPEITECPLCGVHIHRFNKEHIMCTNLNCYDEADNVEATRIKLMTLLPSVPINNMNAIIETMVKYKVKVSVSSVIHFVKRLLRSNESGPPTAVLAEFADAVAGITLSRMLKAVLGNASLDNLDKIIINYNDQLINMIDDLPSVLAPIHSLDVTSDIRILVTMIMNSNKSLLKQILPYWVPSC